MEQTLDHIAQELDRYYMICENQNNEEYCLHILSLLEKKIQDFSLLWSQIRERKNAVMQLETSGFAVELGNDKENANTNSSGNAANKSRLRADAPTFQPTVFVPAVPTPPPKVALPVQVPPPPAAPAAPAIQVTPKTQGKVMPPGLKSQAKTTSQMKESQLKMMNSLPNFQAEKRVRNVPDTSLIAPYDIPKKMSSQPPKDSPGKEEWEKIVHAEMVKATEQVWAAAEAWIEAEADAEEEEWKILELGINRYVGLTQSPRYNHKRMDDVVEEEDDFNEEITAFNSPFVANEASLLTADDSVMLQLPSRVTDKSKDALLFPIRAITPNKPLSSISRSASKLESTRFSTPPISSAGRTLHEKLSSPDRKRALSPTEAKKRYEAKLIAAESNRDKTVAEKVQKASIASTRVRLRMLKEAQKQAQASEALKDKLHNAAQRHVEYLNEIRGKAGTENAKVIEVLSSNALNSEALSNQLQSKLEEVEARILAANIRREQRLSDISGSQRKKNTTKKTDQMSEYRFQLEKQKMERWEKLQMRLEAVQERRRARLAQMQSLGEEEVESSSSTTGNNNSSSTMISSSLLFNNFATIDDISISIIASSDNTPIKIEIHSPSKDEQFSSNLSSSAMGNSAQLLTPEVSGKSIRDLRTTELQAPITGNTGSSKRYGTPHKTLGASSTEGNVSITSHSNKAVSSHSLWVEAERVFPFPKVVIEKAFVKFTDLLNKSKLQGIRNEAWNSALACLETSNSFYSLYCHGSSTAPNNTEEKLSPLQYIVRHYIVDMKKIRNPEERGASSYSLYASTVKEIDEQGLTADNTDLVEKINVLIQQTLDLANIQVHGTKVLLPNEVVWDKIQGFIQTGGVLLLAVLLSREYGMLANAESVQTLFDSSSEEVGKVVVNARNVLHLTFAAIYYLVHYDHLSSASPSTGGETSNTVHIFAGCNIHLLVSELCLFFLFLQQEYHQFQAERTSHTSAQDVQEAMTTLRVELSRMLFMWTQLTLKILHQLDAHNSSAVTQGMQGKLLHNISTFQQYSFLCNHLPLLFSTVQIDVANQLGYLANSAHNSEEEKVDLTPAIALYHNIASYARMIALYVSKHSRSSGSSSSAKHWWSLMRRSQVVQVVVDIFDFAVKALLSQPAYTKREEKRVLLELIQESLDAVFIMITIDGEIFKHVSPNRKYAFMDSMHFYLLTANTEYLADFHKHDEENNLVDRTLYRLFSVLTTLCTVDVEVRKGMSAAQSDAVNGTLSFVSSAPFFVALVNSIRQRRQLSSDESAHYQTLLTHMKSFLSSICSLPIKWYKDQRIKQVLLSALLMASFEIEAHLQLIQHYGKDKYVKKAVEAHLRGNTQTTSLIPLELWNILGTVWTDRTKS